MLPGWMDGSLLSSHQLAEPTSPRIGPTINAVVSTCAYWLWTWSGHAESINSIPTSRMRVMLRVLVERLVGAQIPVGGGGDRFVRRGGEARRGWVDFARSCPGQYCRFAPQKGEVVGFYSFSLDEMTRLRWNFHTGGVMELCRASLAGSYQSSFPPVSYTTLCLVSRQQSPDP